MKDKPYSNAMMRRDIYAYLLSEGFELTEARHSAIHDILAKYETEQMRKLNVKLSLAGEKK